MGYRHYQQFFRRFPATLATRPSVDQFYSFFVFIIMLGLNAHTHESILIAEAHKPFTENRIAEAIEMFKIAISSSNPQKESKIMGLGSIRHQQGYYQHDITRWYFQQIVRQGDNNPYDGLSLCFSITRDYQAATQYYLNMATKYPDNHCLKFGLANAYNNQGKVSQATGLYETILAQSNCNQGKCLRELVMLSFAAQDFDNCRAYLSQMKSFPKEVQVQAIQAFLTNDTKQKIAKIQQLINKNATYTRLPIFLAYIYEKECQDVQRAIEIYENCIDQTEKNRVYWEEPYFCLARLYRKTYKYEQSVSAIKRLAEKIGDNWLAYLFLAEDHLKLSKGHQSLHFLKHCLTEITKDDRIYLSEENRIYLMKSVSQHIQDMQKCLIYNKLAKQIALTDGLYSIFQADININTTKLRMNNTHLLAFLKETSEQPRQSSILQHIYRLFCENESNLQLLELYCSNLIVEAIKKHPMSLQTISQELQNILTIKIVEEKVEVFSQIDPNYGKYEYKLKVKSRVVDAFASKEIATYFSKYSHLFMVIKKIALKVKDIRPWLQLLVEKVKLNPKLLVFNELIALKVDGKNQWICINEVIQQLLPQTSQENHQLLKEVQRSFATSFHKTLPEFTKILIKKWQDVVTRVLDQRRAERKEIRCEISDWAVVQLVFPSQMRLIQSLQDVKHWCQQSGAAIVGVEGHLDRDKELRLRVLIKEVCCMIKLKVNYKLKLKQFQQAIRIIIGNQRNAIFNTLLNLNKHHQYSLLSQIKEMSHYFQHSRNPAAQQIQRSIVNFVGGIECIDNWQQFSRHEKLKLSESWMSPTKIRRHEQRLLTETQDRYPSAHQIRTEVSVQTEQLRPHEIMQQYQPNNTLLRTTSQNNINFAEQYKEADRNQHTPASKRSMFIQPSQSSNIYLSQDQNGKPSFEELPQISKSKKCLQKFGIKYSHSETQSEHELQDMEVNGHKEPTPDINQEISRENEQLKGHIEALFQHNAQLTTNYSLKLSQKETELIQLDKELQRRIQRQIQLLSTIEEMQSQHSRDIMKKEDTINTLRDSIRQKDERLDAFEEVIKNSDESNRQIVSDAKQRVVALQQVLEVAQSESGRLKAENQSLKGQIAARDRQVSNLSKDNHEKLPSEAVSKQIYEQLYTKMKNLHRENLQLQVKLRQAIHQKELLQQNLTRQLDEARTKITHHIKTEGQLREEIVILRAANEQLRQRASQAPPYLNEIKEQANQTFSQREQNERQTKNLRQMVSKMKSEIAVLKTQLDKSSRREMCPCWDKRTSKKRRQYLVILFTILLFQAITVSFTLNLFK